MSKKTNVLKEINFEIDCNKTKPYSRSFVNTITQHNVLYVARARAMLTDPQFEERKKKQYCVVCFYRTRTDAGIDYSECKICLELKAEAGHFVCMDCAKKNNLCTSCASDRDLNSNRRKELR
jgi:hypothetical protein